MDPLLRALLTIGGALLIWEGIGGLRAKEIGIPTRTHASIFWHFRSGPAAWLICVVVILLGAASLYMAWFAW